VTNPFEDKDGVFLALINDEGQYSLWPQFSPIPPGWVAAFGPDNREECLSFVERVWTDMRPKSLIAAMDAEKR
jgi:MbtH protein